MTEQQIDLQERELDYWMARAYEAEGKLWKAEARIKAVQDVLETWMTYCQTEQTGRALSHVRRALEG